MEGKIFNNHKNINNEFEKRNNKKLVYNNIIKSTQKSNSRISLFSKKQSNIKNLKKEKNKETPLLSFKKPLSKKQDIKKEKQEKTNIISGMEFIKQKINSNKKKQNKLNNIDKNKEKNKEKENQQKNINITNRNRINNLDIKNFKQNNTQKNNSTKQKNFKESIYESPISKNTEDELVTSFERKPSDLNSPKTISEDSFLTEEDNNDKSKTNKDLKEEKNINTNDKNKKEKEKDNQKQKQKEEDLEVNDDDNDNDNEIRYIDKIKEIEIEDAKNNNLKLESNNSNKKSKISNIKVNIKKPNFNDNEKSSANKRGIIQYINQSQKIMNKKANNSKDKSFNYSTNNLHIKNKKIFGAFQGVNHSIAVTKKQIIEKKYNRHTNKNSQIKCLEPIQELKKNLSNHSFNICSDKRLAKLKDETINKIKNNEKKDKDIVNKNISHIEDREEDIIFHKKLKIEEENKDNKKRNIKDLSSSNNKNTNISSSLNYTSKDEDVRNKKISKDKIVFKLNDYSDSKKIKINNTSIKNNIKLIKENQTKNKSEVNNNRNKNKNRVDNYYLKKNSHMVNKYINKLALSIEDSNTVNNNCKAIANNMSGNNIIYAPKKPGMSRVRSHERTNGNVYCNMSYDPNRNKNINNSDQKNEQNIGFIPSQKVSTFFNRKSSEVDMSHFLEKNNSFCGDMDIYGRILLNNESAVNSYRLNLYNNIQPRVCPVNYGNYTGNIRMGQNNSNFNYYNKTAEKANNNLFMLNRYTSNGDRINMNLNDYLQNQNYNINRSMNMGLNLNPDYNNYNMNLINNKSMANKINQLNQYASSYNLGMMSPFNNGINQNNLINLLNNNYFNFNTIQNKASSFINNYNINDSVFSYPNNGPNNSPSINIEDIIILQEKLKDIIIALNKTKIMTNECFEFLNFYYNCSIYCQLEKIFTNPIDSNTVRISINYELISIMICYDYSFENEFLEKSYSILENLLKLNYNNLIIICQHILSKISNESKNNIWVKKLSNVINSYKEIDKINNNNMTQIELINYNTNMIIQNLFFILKNYKTLRNDCLINFLNNIRDQTYEQINIFFREYILRTSNLNGSILASVYLRNNTKFNTLPAPYVRTKNNKEFSLVLDLDETLVHFKDKLDVEGSGVLRIRPGVNEFLDEVGKYYELILFTTATQDYADLLIDAIEEDKIYFDHRLYREHAVIIDNDFVKDLNRIGRPLDKIIIVDNMPQNFKLQKENGIMIKPFWGEDSYDTALYELITILVNIAKEGGDIRIGLEKYKDDILKKVSSCISMENI